MAIESETKSLSEATPTNAAVLLMKPMRHDNKILAQIAKPGAESHVVNRASFE